MPVGTLPGEQRSAAHVQGVVEEMRNHADHLLHMFTMRHADIDERKHEDRGGEEFKHGITLADDLLTIRVPSGLTTA